MTPSLVLDQKEAVSAFVASRVPACERGWNGHAALGVALGDKLVAGVIYHDWEPAWGLVQMSAAADTPRWVSRGILRAIFSIPFRSLDARIVVFRVSSLNRHMCSLAERLGFTGHRLPDLRADGEDDVVYLLKREAWENGRFS